MSDLEQAFKKRINTTLKEISTSGEVIIDHLQNIDNDDAAWDRIEELCQQATEGLSALAVLFSKLQQEAKDGRLSELSEAELRQTSDGVARSIRWLVRVVAMSRSERELQGGAEFVEET